MAFLSYQNNTNISNTCKMDPFYEALSLFRKRNYDKCAAICTDLLEKQPLDQAVWCLKMRALTQRVYVDDLDSEELPDGGSGDILDNNAMASAPRPGTSMKTTATKITTGLAIRYNNSVFASK